MSRLTFVLGVAVLAISGGCATGGDRPAATTPAGAGTRCSTASGTVCFLRAPAALDGACTCDGQYGPQAGKVVP